MSARTAAAALRFNAIADDDVNAMSDYFWMMQCGVLDGHTAEAWRAFRAGYAATAKRLAENNGDEPRPGPRRRAA